MRSSESGAAATVIGASAAYFGLVFAVGFGLGTVRVPVAVPVLGERTSELLETPLVLTASLLAVRWVVRRFRLPPGARHLAVGLVALGMLSLALFALMPWAAWALQADSVEPKGR